MKMNIDLDERTQWIVTYSTCYEEKMDVHWWAARKERTRAICVTYHASTSLTIKRLFY